MSPTGDLPLAALRAHPDRAAVLVDFDGTLAPIVPVAGDARPVPGAGDVLLALQDAYAVVAVVSGRPVAFLAAQLPAGLHLVGLYGLEWSVAGDVHHHPEAAAWRAVIDGAAAEARAVLPPEVDVEHKGLSLTLHFRPAPTAAAAVMAWASEAARRTGLLERSAKMSIELHPPIAVDKGTVVRGLVTGLDAACYLGDDAGDLPAFAALDQLGAAGMHVVKVAVTGADAAPDIVTAADVTVAGPDAALALLRTLL